MVSQVPSDLALVERGKSDDRERGGSRVMAQHSGGFVPVAVGHRYIHHDHMGYPLDRKRDRFQAAKRYAAFAFFEGHVSGERLDRVAIVVNEEQPELFAS